MQTLDSEPGPPGGESTVPASDVSEEDLKLINHLAWLYGGYRMRDRSSGVSYKESQIFRNSQRSLEIKKQQSGSRRPRGRHVKLAKDQVATRSTDRAVGNGLYHPQGSEPTFPLSVKRERRPASGYPGKGVKIMVKQEPADPEPEQGLEPDLDPKGKDPSKKPAQGKPFDESAYLSQWLDNSRYLMNRRFRYGYESNVNEHRRPTWPTNFTLADKIEFFISKKIADATDFRRQEPTTLSICDQFALQNHEAMVADSDRVHYYRAAIFWTGHSNERTEGRFQDYPLPEDHSASGARLEESETANGGLNTTNADEYGSSRNLYGHLNPKSDRESLNSEHKDPPDRVESEYKNLSSLNEDTLLDRYSDDFGYKPADSCQNSVSNLTSIDTSYNIPDCNSPSEATNTGSVDNCSDKSSKAEFANKYYCSNKRILEIGTGPMCVLAMNALKAGAKSIDALEVSDHASRLAGKLMAAYGFDNVIKVFNTHSKLFIFNQNEYFDQHSVKHLNNTATCSNSDYEVCGGNGVESGGASTVEEAKECVLELELPEEPPYDMVISEILGDFASQEGVADVFLDFQRRVLFENRRFLNCVKSIPCRVATMFVPCFFPDASNILNKSSSDSEMTIFSPSKKMLQSVGMRIDNLPICHEWLPLEKLDLESWMLPQMCQHFFNAFRVATFGDVAGLLVGIDVEIRPGEHFGTRYGQCESWYTNLLLLDKEYTVFENDLILVSSVANLTNYVKVNCDNSKIQVSRPSYSFQPYILSPINFNLQPTSTTTTTTTNNGPNNPNTTTNTSTTSSSTDNTNTTNNTTTSNSNHNSPTDSTTTTTSSSSDDEEQSPMDHTTTDTSMTTLTTTSTTDDTITTANHNVTTNGNSSTSNICNNDAGVRKDTDGTEGSTTPVNGSTNQQPEQDESTDNIFDLDLLIKNHHSPEDGSHHEEPYRSNVSLQLTCKELSSMSYDLHDKSRINFNKLNTNHEVKGTNCTFADDILGGKEYVRFKGELFKVIHKPALIYIDYHEQTSTIYYDTPCAKRRMHTDPPKRYNKIRIRSIK